MGESWEKLTVEWQVCKLVTEAVEKAKFHFKWLHHQTVFNVQIVPSPDLTVVSIIGIEHKENANDLFISCNFPYLAVSSKLSLWQ